MLIRDTRREMSSSRLVRSSEVYHLCTIFEGGHLGSYVGETVRPFGGVSSATNPIRDT